MTSAKEASTAKAEAILKQKEMDVREAVADLTVEGAVQGITNLNLEISRSLAGLSDKLVREVNTLQSVREAITLEQAEIERLHKIDVATTALDILVKEYQEQKNALEEPRSALRGLPGTNRIGNENGNRRNTRMPSKSSASARSKNMNTRRRWNARRLKINTKRICGYSIRRIAKNRKRWRKAGNRETLS